MSQLGNLSPEGSIALGVIVCLLSSGIQSLGLTLQRKSHMLEETQYLDSPRPAYKRRRWQVGFSLFLVANLVGSTIQLSILPLPVLAALQAAGLVFNSINATWILGEDFTRWSLIGTVLVSGGALLIAYFGALPEPAHSLNQLLALFVRGPFIAWAVVQALLISSIFAGIYLMRRLSPSRGQSKKTRLARGMCYGALSGMLSAHSVLMAKSAVELLVRTVADGENQFAHWQSWMILIALVIIGLSQLYCLNSGLHLCSTSVLYPFVFCVYNVITILDGLIYFNQGSRMSGRDTGLIVLGTFILLIGVFCLSWRLAAEDDSAHQPPEVSENLLTPPVGVTRSPYCPKESDGDGERQPLLSGSPNEQEPGQFTFSFRPSRAPAGHGDTAHDQHGDEEATVGLGRDNAPHSGPLASQPKPPKARKRATFANFGTLSLGHSRSRSSTNPDPNLNRRPSILSQYVRTKSRRISLADSRLLWGELEESGLGPGVATGATDTGTRSAGLPAARPNRWSAPPARRMSEGSGRLLGSRPAGKSQISQMSKADGEGNGDYKSYSYKVSKLGDASDAIEDEADDHANGGNDQMTSSVPLLQRSETGRLYRKNVSGAPEAVRRRRFSVPDGANVRVSNPQRQGWTWHTIDASAGRPSEYDNRTRPDNDGGSEASRAGAGSSAAAATGRRTASRGSDTRESWDWRSWRRWLPGKSHDGQGEEGEQQHEEEQ